MIELKEVHACVALYPLVVVLPQSIIGQLPN